MKKMLLIFCTLISLSVSIFSQQTQDLGNGMKVIFNTNSDGMLNGAYVVKINHRSANGGTSIGTLTGKMLNGKKTGAWIGSIQYSNYGIQEDWFIQGNISLVRTYSDGTLNGEYTYNSKIKGRKGSYNYFTNSWGYMDWIDESQYCSAFFENGIPTRIKIKQNKPFTDIEIFFRNGLPEGQWKINDINKHLSMILENGFLTYSKSFNIEDNWGYEVKYTPTEIAAFETAKNVQKVNAIGIVDPYCLYGGYFKNILSVVSSGSTETIAPIYYKIVDQKLHENLIGDVPDWKISLLESDKRFIIKQQKEEGVHIFLEKYGSEFNEKYKDYYYFFKLVDGSKDYFELQFYKDKKEIMELAEYDNRIDQIRVYDPQISDNDAEEYVIHHSKLKLSGRIGLDLSYYTEIERAKFLQLYNSPLTEMDIRMYLYSKYGYLRYPLTYDNDLIRKILKFRNKHIYNGKIEYPELPEWIEFMNRHKAKIKRIDKVASSVYKYYQKKLNDKHLAE